jgi:hypothetical protein
MCSFEWIGLHFKAIFRRLSGFERPENSPVESFQWFERPEICPVDSMDASLDTLRVLQQDGAGRPEKQGTGKAARETIQPGQKKRYRDIVRRGIPENPVAAMRS